MDQDITELRDRMWKYLTEEGHPLRLDCLRDLCAKDVFCSAYDSPAVLLKKVTNYLDENPRRFCQDDIDRFRAVLEPPKPKEYVYFNSGSARIWADTRNRDSRYVTYERGDEVVTQFAVSSSIGKAMLEALTDPR